MGRRIRRRHLRGDRGEDAAFLLDGRCRGGTPSSEQGGEEQERGRRCSRAGEGQRRPLAGASPRVRRSGRGKPATGAHTAGERGLISDVRCHASTLRTLAPRQGAHGPYCGERRGCDGQALCCGELQAAVPSPVGSSAAGSSLENRPRPCEERPHPPLIQTCCKPVERAGR